MLQKGYQRIERESLYVDSCMESGHIVHHIDAWGEQGRCGEEGGGALSPKYILIPPKPAVPDEVPRKAATYLALTVCIGKTAAARRWVLSKAQLTASAQALHA
jgi:hypothetical protein